jgi:hypothetical protein
MPRLAPAYKTRPGDKSCIRVTPVGFSKMLRDGLEREALHLGQVHFGADWHLSG